MRTIFIGALALISFATTASTKTETIEANPAQTLLTQMRQASDSLDFELSYILVRKNIIEPYRYRHARINDENYYQLLNLSGSMREVIKRGDVVSYFESGVEPFTIRSEQMVVPMPSVFHTDIDKLGKIYDFVSLGRAREAGVSCDVVRISPKGGERYSYVVWIDDVNKLLMRADLLDRDGEPIEQFRTIALNVSPSLKDAMQAIDQLELPQVLSLPKAQNVDMQWTVSYLPMGFQSVYKNRHRLFMTGRSVESQMFTDGLFSFSVYLANADEHSVKEQLARKGSRTLHSHVLGNTEITVVGDLPPLTAKKIAESVRFLPQKKSKENTTDKVSE